MMNPRARPFVPKEERVYRIISPPLFSPSPSPPPIGAERSKMNELKKITGKRWMWTNVGKFSIIHE